MKRVIDVFLTLLGLAVLFPLMLFIGLQVKKKLGSPVFFRQTRPGLEGKPFTMLKFRTMKDSVSEPGIQQSDAERLTPYGMFLRSFSLDELPGLWSVLKGDMSLVGPRPLLMEYLPLYSEKQMRRHEVKPGITGWAQVNGRNALTWEEKFELDIWYVENQSFWLDLKILLMTVKKVFVRDGISHQGEVTMKRFLGSTEEDL